MNAFDNNRQGFNSKYLLQIGQARFRAPEVLFRPDLIGEECEGIHEVLMYSIQKSDMDLRKMLYQNIVLSGGSTLFKGFGDRLLQEIKKNVAKDMKIRVSKMNLTLKRALTNDGDWSVDCSSPRTAVLDLDGRLDSRVSRHFQENVDIETRIRRGRSARCSPKDILGTFSTVNFELI